MSLKLILMRHAKSGWDDPVEDHDRPLNSRGRISAEVMGNGYKQRDIFRRRRLYQLHAAQRKPFAG